MATIANLETIKGTFANTGAGIIGAEFMEELIAVLKKHKNKIKAHEDRIKALEEA